MKKSLLILPLLLICIACPNNLASNARDTAAALSGAISAAQTQYQASCTADPKQQVCTVINQSIAGENALITATEAYCGWSTTAPPPNPTTTACVPVSNLQGGLQTAMSNATLFISELKGVIK